MLSILITIFPHDPRRACYTIALSILIWFSVDSGFSLYAGSVAHAVFNTLFLVLFAIPLIGIYRYFQRENQYDSIFSSN